MSTLHGGKSSANEPLSSGMEIQMSFQLFLLKLLPL